MVRFTKFTWDVSEGFQVVVGDVVGVDNTAADHVPVLYTWVMTCTVRGDHYQTQSTFHLTHCTKSDKIFS